MLILILSRYEWERIQVPVNYHEFNFSYYLNISLLRLLSVVFVTHLQKSKLTDWTWNLNAYRYKSLILYIIRKVLRNAVWLWQTSHWRIRNTSKFLGSHFCSNSSIQIYFICNFGTRKTHKEVRPGCGSTQNENKAYERNPHAPLTRARKCKVYSV